MIINIVKFCCYEIIYILIELSIISFPLFFIAIGTHKFVIIFCVGLELYNAGTPGKEYMMYMLMYSFMSPVGIGIGTVIDIGVEHQHGSSYHATVGILQVKFWSKDLSKHIK